MSETHDGKSKKSLRETTLGKRWHDWQNGQATIVAGLNPRDAGLMGFKAGWVAAFEAMLDERAAVRQQNKEPCDALAP